MIPKHWQIYTMIPLVTEWREHNKILINLNSPSGNFLMYVIGINVSVNESYEDINHRESVWHKNVDKHRQCAT